MKQKLHVVVILSFYYLSVFGHANSVKDSLNLTYIQSKQIKTETATFADIITDKFGELESNFELMDSSNFILNSNVSKLSFDNTKIEFVNDDIANFNRNNLLNQGITKSRLFNDLNTKTSRNSPVNSHTVSEFDESYVKNNFPIDSITSDFLLEAKAVMDTIEMSQNYIDLISPKNLVKLPVGIKTQIGTVTYSLGITNAVFNPEFAEVTAFVQIIIPQRDEEGQKKLFFGAHKIKLSHQGGIYGDANLVLIGDVPIQINGGNGMLVVKGGFNKKTGDLKEQSYVTIDCNGFKELSISADVLFPRSMLEPVDSDFKVIPNKSKKVKGHFQTVVGDWNDILAEIDLPPFQLTKEDSTNGSGKAGIVFDLKTAIFDFSDLRNSDNIKFPKTYQQYLIPENENAWRGVYAKSLKVILPKQFEKRNSDERVVFEASNLLIDAMGVSGTFSANKILPLNEGVVSGWQFSLDRIEASLVANQLISAGFNGKLVLPLAKEVTQEDLNSPDSTSVKNKALQYTAFIDPVNEDYLLSVASQNSINFNLFKAKATLAPNSYIELKLIEDKFRPKAVLHGNLAIKGSNSTSDPDKGTVDFKGVVFQKLQLQSELPYFKVDYLGYVGEAKLANFPATISEISMEASNSSAKLCFGIDINMMSNGFSGGTTLEIVGKFNKKEGLHRWKYDHLKINRISIAADLGSVKLKGFVDIKEDDPDYGDGFYGELDADFNNIKVSASAWFGKKEFRYWYADAYADLSKAPTKMYIGPAIVNGFGGGAYYRMTKKAGTPTSKIPSGQSYLPDEKSGLGFRALLGFALANEKAFNGKVGFEMAFNKHGGLNRVLFFGEGHIVKALDFKFGDKFKEKLTAMENKINSFGENSASMNKLKEANLVEYSKIAFPQNGLTFDIGIDAHFSMEMDFRNHVFHSEMEVFVNTPGGLFEGVGSKGRAGWAVFHASDTDWFLHMGTPTDRVGLKLGFDDLSIQATSYLMIGDNVPSSPPPPAIVAEIIGTDMETLDYMRDLNALSEGRGFALGMDLSIDTGDLTFLIFYARFQAGLGFDIMVKDYSETTCAGSGPLGIDGWYANGQAYAYLQGELGINVNLLLVHKKIPIIQTGSAILLQAKLPNPVWFRGYLAGHFNLLGGLVKGRFRFKVELGEECEIIDGSQLGGLKIISDITPEENDDNVDVFAIPQAVFNMQINQPFELEDDTGINTYRILLDKFEVLNKGELVPGNIELNENKNEAHFISDDILPPNTLLEIKVEVRFQEQQGTNWITLTEDGQVAMEVAQRTFTTGAAPDYIPFTNIIYCYPVIDQKHFYKEERNTGYVKLNRGQSYLFSPKTEWQQLIQFENRSGMQSISEISYSQNEKTVNFNLSTLNNQEEYTLRIISFPLEKENTQNNIEDNYTSQETGQEGTIIEILNKQAEEVSKESVKTEILRYNFTTSSYNTFAEKIESKKITNSYLEPIYADVHALQTDVEQSELFELIELQGGKYTDFIPLVSIEAVLNDDYYSNSIYPLIYENYPIDTQFTFDREVSILGIPPKKGMDILTWYTTYLENKSTHSLLNVRIPYRYNLPFHYKQDFVDIQYKIVNMYLQNSTQFYNQMQKFNYIINGVFPAIQTGNYQVKLQYVLPGNIQGSSATFNYNNPF